MYSENGKLNTNISLKEGLDLVRNLGVGEVLISSIDNDDREVGMIQKYSQNSR